MFDPDPSFEENVRRCRRNKKGELYQRGKFKQSSLNAAKSEFVNSITKSRENDHLINSMIRDDIVKKIKTDPDVVFSKPLHRDFVKLLSDLPDDLRLWKYNNNTMNKYRGQIDSLSDKILNEYFPE